MAKGKFRRRMVSPGPTAGVPAGVLLVFLVVLGVPSVAAALSGSY